MHEQFSEISIISIKSTLKFKSWLKAAPSSQNNGDFSAPRCLGVSYFNCICTYFKWFTCQIHCLHGGFTISLHKHPTDGKKESAGGPRGCLVTWCWGLLCSGRMLLTVHRPALSCFFVKCMLQVALWIYFKGQCCWYQRHQRDCSFPIFYPICPYDRVQDLTMFWKLTGIFLIFFWTLKLKYPPLLYYIPIISYLLTPSTD